MIIAILVFAIVAQLCAGWAFILCGALIAQDDKDGGIVACVAIAAQLIASSCWVIAGAQI